MKVFLFFDFSELICKVPSQIFLRKKKWKKLCTDKRAQRWFYATEAFKICYRITPPRSSFNYRFKSASIPRWIFTRQSNGQLSQFQQQQWNKFIRHGTELVCWSEKATLTPKANRQWIISTGKVREITKFTSNARKPLTTNEKTFLLSISLRRRREAKVFLAVLILLLRRLLWSTRPRTICTRRGM